MGNVRVPVLAGSKSVDGSNHSIGDCAVAKGLHPICEQQAGCLLLRLSSCRVQNRMRKWDETDLYPVLLSKYVLTILVL